MKENAKIHSMINKGEKRNDNSDTIVKENNKKGRLNMFVYVSAAEQRPMAWLWRKIVSMRSLSPHSRMSAHILNDVILHNRTTMSLSASFTLCSDKKTVNEQKGKT